MALTHFPTNEPSTSPTRRWWFSLYPRLSAATKRSLLLLSLSAALLVNSQLHIANRQRAADAAQVISSDSPYTIPAVQHALHELGLPGRDPVGDEFQVNTYTTSLQTAPAVALDSDGDFVVVWESNGSYGNDTGFSIQAQRYNSAGTAQGSEFQVNSYTTGAQRIPAVGMDSDGDFVVVWASNGSYGNDTSYFSIQGQRYNSVGTAQGSQFQVNSYTTSSQAGTEVAMDSDGDFVVVWHSDGSNGNDTSLTSIQGQRYNSVGTAQGSQFQVNSYTTDYQGSPMAAMDSDGDFTVEGIPQVALDSDGDFVIVWQSMGITGDIVYSIQGQRYNSAGTIQGNQFRVNSYTTHEQSQPEVALDDDGDFVVVWQSFGSSGTDTDNFSIQGQRYNAVVDPATPTPTPTPSPTPTHTPTPTLNPTDTPTPTPTTAPGGHPLYLPAVLRN